MSAKSWNESGMKMFLLIYFCVMLGGATSSPLFFYNPFAPPKTPDGESENVSIYTTTLANLEGRPVTQPPTIYHQIARNVLERIASPVVSHFILVGATERSAKLVSTSPKPSTKSNQLEIVEDSVTEKEDFNSTESTDVQIEETENREETHPSFTKTNPSFNKTILRDNSKPERLVQHPELMQNAKNASEVDDLNRVTGDFFDSISDLPDDDVEINNDREEIDPNEIRTKAAASPDVSSTTESDDEDDQESEDSDEEIVTERPSLKKNFHDDTRVIYVLELVGSVYAIFMGLLQSLFNRSSM